MITYNGLPLLNSSNPWATTESDLRTLYENVHTCAVTVRTSLMLGWKHDDRVNQYTFFDAKSSNPAHSQNADSSLNTLGYSPVSLEEYLDMIESITHTVTCPKKPWIISVTGNSQEIVQCYDLIVAKSNHLSVAMLMEVNLSCPNIVDKPPPAYSKEALQEYLTTLASRSHEPQSGLLTVPIGIKCPPYTYQGQFSTLVAALMDSMKSHGKCIVDFITSTNTLGGCLLYDVPSGSDSAYEPALGSASGMGLGGLGGAAIHTLSLGNVRTIRTMLDEHEELKSILIIGVGGVGDASSYSRMRAAGAAFVAVGTALGISGVEIFETIANGVQDLA